MQSRVQEPEFSCGIDEAGRGPVIGPMIISMVCGNSKNIKETGAKDSKELSQNSRLKIFEKLKSDAEIILVRVIESKELDLLMEKMTINQIEEKYALELIKEAPYDIFVDSFDVNEERCSETLSRKSGKNVICRHKADRDYSVVSAASVVSKVKREEEMDKIRKTFEGVGSGYPSDPT
ncbi:ribonuclease HII, partial [mine drainage metagenome]